MNANTYSRAEAAPGAGGGLGASQTRVRGQSGRVLSLRHPSYTWAALSAGPASYTHMSIRWRVLRVRKPSCCKGPQGLQARSSSTQAYGQEQLFHLTDNIHSEL
ncbi:uncharacterized protein LOC118360430 isoform X1 [Oncorhynchus keta]|uniref:uncharacterized protein LOC118360430 isoform X1 n=1 Tax=Oncorhynchus keta TaxID=8018 RepID=UPI00227B5F10|nr:uncharacterized protein LOC118360430 isoform X1 [Oncorhynchus keta]